LKYVSYIRVGGYQGEKLPLAVNATGSRVSKLMKILKEGHYDVQLSQAKWRTLAAWIDTNAQYYGGWDEIVIKDTIPHARVDKYSKVKLRRPVTQVDSKNRRQRIKELNNPRAYINCGIEKTSGEPSKEVIRQRNGSGWFFENPDRVKGLKPGNTEWTYSSSKIIFDIENLQADAKYKLGLTWWDHSNAGRKQSVWVTTIDGDLPKKIMNATVLPAYKDKGQMPSQHVMDLPAKYVSKGKLRICIWNQGDHNTIVSEVWLELEE
jgi:hypothetical protein